MPKQHAVQTPIKIENKLDLFDWMLSQFTTRSDHECWVHPRLTDFEPILATEVHRHGGLRKDFMDPTILFECFMEEVLGRVKMPRELALLAYDICAWNDQAEPDRILTLCELITRMADTHNDMFGIVYEVDGQTWAKLRKRDPRGLGAYFNLPL